MNCGNIDFSPASAPLNIALAFPPACNADAKAGGRGEGGRLGGTGGDEVAVSGGVIPQVVEHGVEDGGVVRKVAGCDQPIDASPPLLVPP